jgi:hypothetical protein
LVGEASIKDFLEDNRRARFCKNLYHSSLTYSLTKHDWAFARKYTVLNALVLTDEQKKAVPGDTIVYELPSDCLIPRNLLGRSGRVKWEVMGNKLYTDKECVGLYYTNSETRPEEFSDTFVRVLSLDIAVKLSGPMSQDKQFTSSLYRQYLSELDGSYETDSNIGDWYRESTSDPENDTFVNTQPSEDAYT